MRLTAALRVLASALSERLFQPTYILDDSKSLFGVMSKLARDDPTREFHLRSVLLDVYPHKQRDNGRRQAKKVVQDVLYRVKPLLPVAKQAAFEGALEAMCIEFVDKWMKLQKHFDVIEPSFDFRNTQAVPGCWRIFQLPTATTAVAEKPHMTNGNGTSSTPPSPTDKKGRQTPDEEGEQQSPRRSSADVEGVVWPAFLTLSTDGSRRAVKKGHVVMGDQIKVAADEDDIQTRPAATQRKILRSATAPMNGKALRSAKRFLRGGGGQKPG